MAIDLRAKRRAAVDRLCRVHAIEILYVFGSRGKEILATIEPSADVVAGPDSSDVDIAAKARGPLSTRQKVEIAQALETILGVERVDLVDLADAGSFLAANAVRGERLYAADVTAADEYDLYVLRRAGDLAPFERQRIALILNRPDPA
jgi:hypothetical protein